MNASSLPPRWDAYARRLSASLADLRGPAVGEVELPLHVAWSGRRVYDVGQVDQRLVLYALGEGLGREQASPAEIKALKGMKRPYPGLLAAGSNRLNGPTSRS
jgi:hypothetical protein